MDHLRRSFAATMDDANPAERTIVAKISVGDVDRHRTLIDSRGIDLTNFRQNPVVLFEHGLDPTRGAVPIGRCLWVRHDGSGNGRLIAKTQFSRDAFSQTLFDFYRDGTMRGWSIQGGRKDASPPTREEIRRRPELADCELIYRSIDLYEYSAVSVPSCASALSDPELRSLSKLVVRGFWSPSEEVKPLIDSLCVEVDPETEEAPADETPAEEVATDAEVARDAPTEDVVEAVVETDPETAEPVVEETVERSAPEAEPIAEASPEPEKEVEPEPVVEPAKPELPPLVGRTLEEVVKSAVDPIGAFERAFAEKMKDLQGWLRGEA
jgi:hypothetical protein